MQGICECEVSIASWLVGSGWHRNAPERKCGAKSFPLGHHNLLAIGGDQQSQHLSAHNLGPILLVAGLFCAAGLTTLYITTPFSRLLMTVSDSHIGVVSHLRRKS